MNQRKKRMLSPAMKHFAVRLTIVTFVSIAAFTLTTTVTGQDEFSWHTGRELDRFNESAISAWWTDAEFRDRIIKFSESQRVAVFIDRRIDPSTLIDLTVKDATKEQLLWSLAKELNLGVCRIEDVYYFGPLESAANLPGICDQLRQTTSAQRRNTAVNWSDTQPMLTEPFVEPKKLLLDLAQQNQFQVNNPEAIPHDLWAGFELPETSLQVRVALILVGFGKSFERSKDGATIEIVDSPTQKSTKLNVRIQEKPQPLARSLRANYPKLKVSIKGSRLVVSGSPLDVAAAQREIVAAQIPTGIDNSNKTYTFTLRASRGALLATAAQYSDSKLVFDSQDRAVVDALQEQIEVAAVNVDVAELLRLSLEGSNLKAAMVDGELRITER